MASKIQNYHLYVAIKPYKVEEVEDQFDELDVSVGYTDHTRKFYVNLHPGWKSTFGHGCVIMGDCNPLTASTWVDVKPSERNSQKTINEMGANLELAKYDIAWLFNERKFEQLKQLVKDVALYGYTASIEERMKGYKNEAMVTAQVEAVEVKSEGVKSEGVKSEKSNSKPTETMEVNNMKAADLIGKTIIVGENIATITIKSADGDRLQGEFKKAGATMGMFLPITLENLRQQITSGAWQIAGGEVKSEKLKVKNEATAEEGSEEPEFTEYEEVTDSDEDPVMQQWREAKGKNPDAVIIFRNGNVYVVIAEDAAKVAEVAGLQLTQNDGTAICVFPAAELSVVLPKVIRAGLRTAIVDLISEPEGEVKSEEVKSEEVKSGGVKSEKSAEPETCNVKPETKAAPRRVQPKAVKVEEPEEPEEPEAPMDNGQCTARPNGTLDASRMDNDSEDVVTTEPETTAKVQPKRPSECTLEAKKCAPYIIDQGGACIYVGGNTEKLDEILYLMWGRKRAYQEGENKYSGVQVSRKHKKMLEAIMKIA